MGKQKDDSRKDEDAVRLGRLGGKKGGPARAAILPAARRKAIAKQGAMARWHGRHKGNEDG